MENQYQSRCPVKKLKPTDVSDRLALPKHMAAVLPPAQPGSEIPIRVLDLWHRVYHFRLSVRRGRRLKPVFQYKEWQDFVRDHGAEEGNLIYLRREVNADAGTEYRIVLYKEYL